MVSRVGVGIRFILAFIDDGFIISSVDGYGFFGVFESVFNRLLGGFLSERICFGL